MLQLYYIEQLYSDLIFIKSYSHAPMMIVMWNDNHMLLQVCWL